MLSKLQSKYFYKLKIVIDSMPIKIFISFTVIIIRLTLDLNKQLHYQDFNRHGKFSIDEENLH